MNCDISLESSHPAAVATELRQAEVDAELKLRLIKFVPSLLVRRVGATYILVEEMVQSTLHLQGVF